MIGDDHALMRSGIQTLLEQHYDVVGAAADGRQLVEAAARLRPDLVVLDVSMPQLNGFEAAKQIRAAFPSIKLVFLSMHSSPVYLRRAFETGASAYVLKAGAIEELENAVRKVFSGDIYLSPGLGDRLEWLSNSGKPAKASEDLTQRQVEILQLIAEGRTSKEIAHILEISTKTVDFHRARIMARLGAHSTAEMVRTAVEQNLIPASTTEVHHAVEKAWTRPAGTSKSVPEGSSAKTALDT